MQLDKERDIRFDTSIDRIYDQELHMIELGSASRTKGPNEDTEVLGRYHVHLLHHIFTSKGVKYVEEFRATWK